MVSGMRLQSHCRVTESRGARFARCATRLWPYNLLRLDSDDKNLRRTGGKSGNDTGDDGGKQERSFAQDDGAKLRARMN